MSLFDLIKQNLNEYRSFPFWSWNDKLEKEELISQMKGMQKVNIGGFFMHARGGLETPYMSEEWMDCVETCIDYASRNNMSAWAYDENGWPSGSANDVVPSMDVEFQQKWLQIKSIESNNDLPENILCIYKNTTEGYKIINNAETGCKVIYYGVNPHYIDTFNPQAINCFIEQTHKKYYNRFSKYFGKTLKGFFTDEPQYGNTLDPVWSNTFIESYKSMFGGNILEKLPLLFENTLYSKKFIYDYYSMVGKMFRETFIKKLYDWCEEHNCKLTGHMMNEQNLQGQMKSTAGVMPCYEYFHLPGIDWLGRFTDSPMTPKQLGSVAAQLGKQTFTETFAMCGWDVSLNELKEIMDWQVINGVNILCHHLAGYTLRGIRKRDYPASLFTQAPYFDETFGEFNEYFARLASLMEKSKEYAPFLIIHPLKSAFLYANNPECYEIGKLNDSFVKVTSDMTNLHLQHHYGDEDIIEKYGRVEKEKFIIGNCEYKYVVLPLIETLKESTVKKLLEFAGNGGIIFAPFGGIELVDGVSSDLVDTLNKLIFECPVEKIVKYIKAEDHYEVIDNEGVCEDLHFCIRDIPKVGRICYIINRSQRHISAKWVINDFLSVKEIDLIKESEKNIEYVDGKVYLTFAPKESKIIYLSNEKVAWKTANEQIKYLDLKPDFDIVYREENTITLDMCKYRVDGGNWQPVTSVISIQEKLLKLCRPCNVELEFGFYVENKEEIGSLYLVLECYQNFVMRINGEKYDFSDCGYYRDKSFRKSDISKFIKTGYNKIYLKTKFEQYDKVYKVLSTPGIHESEINRLSYKSELESIYIIGEFSVINKEDYRYGRRKTIFAGKEFSICKTVKKIDCRKITEGGFWFFSGKMILHQTVNVNLCENIKYFFELKKLNCPAASLRVNGREVGNLIFSPFKLDVTDYILNGENDIEIVLRSGNRNLLGPHHKPFGESYAVSPRSFINCRVLEDEGDIYWDNNYNFVKFGFEL